MGSLDRDYVQVHREKNGNMTYTSEPTVSISAAEAWEKELLSDPKNKLALNALLSNDIRTIVSNKVATLTDTQTFNVKIPFEGAPVTNQRSSGRCWLFAATNVLRVPIMKQYNLKEFELSQAYLFFWDKLEKANWFLEQIMETTKESLDSRIVQELLGAPVNDGGQWDMAANLVAKYGLVSCTATYGICLTLLGTSISVSRLFQRNEFQRHEPAHHYQTPRRCTCTSKHEIFLGIFRLPSCCQS